MAFDIVSYFMGKSAGGGGGGGGGTAVAVVKAVYEPGKTATATKGTATLTSDTSGVYLFLLPEAGVWTFACDGVSRTITAEANGMYNVGFVLLPYSNPADILASAEVEDFDTTTWGEISLSGSVTVDSTENAVKFENGAWGHCDLAAANTDVTVYCVYKQLTPVNGDRVFVSAPYDLSYGNAPGFFCRNGILFTTFYAQDVSLGIDATAAYHVVTFSVNDKTVQYYVDGVHRDTKTAYNSGAIVTFGAESGGSLYSNGLFKFGAVVSGAESSNVISQNHQAIMSYFGIGGNG